MRPRLIFTLLYASGAFMLSRNFRLQKIGDLRWLMDNYQFGLVAESIDELLILDVSRGEQQSVEFLNAASSVVADCFVPVGFGGGVRSLRQMDALFRAGADKIVLNTPLFEEPDLVSDIAREIGAQSIVASVDVRSVSERQVMTTNGSMEVSGDLPSALAHLADLPFGELLLNSIDRDGTGMGLDFGLLDEIPSKVARPVILSGGVGNAAHIAEALRDPRVSAVATANLLNFVGDGLMRARGSLVEEGFNLASFIPWKEDSSA